MWPFLTCLASLCSSEEDSFDEIKKCNLQEIPESQINYSRTVFHKRKAKTLAQKLQQKERSWFPGRKRLKIRFHRKSEERISPTPIPEKEQKKNYNLSISTNSNQVESERDCDAQEQENSTRTSREWITQITRKTLMVIHDCGHQQQQHCYYSSLPCQRQRGK